ncbi:YfhO family protein [Helcococcus kunzii]
MKRKFPNAKDKRLNLIFVIAIFTIISLIIHSPYLRGRLLLGVDHGDPIAQMYPFRHFIIKNFARGNFFYSFSYGLGGDFFTELSYYYTTSPIFYLVAIIGRITRIYNGSFLSSMHLVLLASILTQILSQIFMYILLEYEYNKDGDIRKKKLNIISSIIYGTTTYLLYRYLGFDFMAESFVYLPLVCYGIRKFDKERKPLLFIISFGIMVMSNFYFAFMNCIFIFTFMMIYSFEYTSFKNFISQVFERAKLVILGFGISAIGFLPSVYAFLHSDRQPVETTSRLFVKLDQIQYKLSSLFLNPNVIGGAIFLAFIILIYSFMLNKNVLRKNIISLLWCVLFFSPLAHSIMNGFSYESDRWYYLIAFAICFVLPYNLHNIIEKSKSIDFNMKIIYAIILLIGMIFLLGRHPYSFYALVCELIVLIILLFINKTRYMIDFLMIFVLGVSLIYNRGYINSRSPVLKDNNYYLNKATGTYGIDFNDDSFYRIANKKAENNDFIRRENSEMILGNRGTTVYNSVVNKDLMKWFKKDHNIWTFFTSPSHFRGLDNRLFLETIWGVKYKVNFDNDQINYDKKTKDNKIYYENPNNIGIDFWYDNYIPKEKYDKFSHAQKDAALMQSAVIEDKLNIDEANLDKTIENIDVDLNTAEIIDGKFENGILKIPYKKGKHAEDANRGKIIIPLSGKKENGEYLISFRLDLINKNIEDRRLKYVVDVNDRKIYKYKDTYQWTYLQDDFTIRVDGKADQIVISLTPGEYKFSNIDLSFSSYKNYEKWTNKLNKYNLENLVMKDDKIVGDIHNKENGVLGLSIPYSENWKISVDGKQVKTLRIDNALMGVYLEKGNHKVEIKYVPKIFYIGLGISLLSIALVTYFYIIKPKKTKDETFNKR